MSSQPRVVIRLTKLFSKQPCWKIADLSRVLGYSVISVRRFLKGLGYYRSYSHNGRWHTLREYPDFNKEGIWIYDEGNICFSRHGNLNQTIIHMIGKSAEGLLAREIAGRLHHPCHAVLTHLYKEKQIDRVKSGPEFVYVSTRQGIGGRQRARIEEREKEESVTTLSAEAAVSVLVEIIKDPRLTCEQLARCLRKERGITVVPESISRFLQEQGVKKTVGAPSLGPYAF